MGTAHGLVFVYSFRGGVSWKTGGFYLKLSFLCRRAASWETMGRYLILTTHILINDSLCGNSIKARLSEVFITKIHG